MESLKIFTHPRNYVGNNMRFRIEASEAQMRFKLQQAYILKELKQNPTHKFSSTGRDILLFKYDVWWDFLVKLEQYFLVNKDNLDRVYIGDVIQKIDRYYYDTLIGVGNIDKEYVKLWYQTHKYLFDIVYEYIVEHLISLEDYPYIVDLISRVLTETFYEVYEIDYVIYKKEIILNVSDLCVDIREKLGKSLVKDRVKIYSRYLKTKEVKSLKYYGDDDKIETCVKELKSLGFDIKGVE